MADLFEFWSPGAIARGEFIHPAVREALSKYHHKFDLCCLSGCCRGPLRTAALVLLYLAPGWSEQSREMAKEEKYIDRNFRMRTGNEPMAEQDDNDPGWRWAEQRTRVFGPWEALRKQLAFTNIVAYQSPGEFHDWWAIEALPSCRVKREWAKDVLFPEARRGDRIVICMRSAKQWGLPPRGTPPVGQLYVPLTTQGGHMYRDEMRKKIVAAVKERIGPP